MSDEEEEAVLTNNKRRKIIRSEFIDDEAELSGDDVVSEDEDEASDDDQLLEDLVDKDAKELDSDQEEQIRGLYHKQLESDDKRALLLLKEQLEDNDIVLGQRRRRKFRWQTKEMIDNNLGRHGDPDDDDSQDYDSDDLDDYDDLKPRLRRPGAETLRIGSTRILSRHLEDEANSSGSNIEPRPVTSVSMASEDSNSNAIMSRIVAGAVAKSSDISRFVFRDRETVQALSTRDNVIVSREDRDKLVQRELRRVLQSKSIFDQIYT